MGFGAIACSSLEPRSLAGRGVGGRCPQSPQRRRGVSQEHTQTPAQGTRPMAVMYIGPRSRGDPDSGFFESSSRDGGRRAASRVPRSGEGGEKASQAVRRGTPPGDAFAEQHGRCSEDLRQEAPPGGAPRQGRPAGGLRRAARRPDALGGARRRRRAGGRRRRSTARRRRGARGGRGRRRRRRHRFTRSRGPARSRM